MTYPTQEQIDMLEEVSRECANVPTMQEEYDAFIALPEEEQDRIIAENANVPF